MYYGLDCVVTSRPRPHTHTAPDAPPQNLALTPLTSTSIRVAWEAPPIENQRGILTNYTISYQMEGITTSAISMTVEASVLFLELTGLEKFTMYSVTVSASTMIGSGPGAVETVKTLSDSECIGIKSDLSNTHPYSTEVMCMYKLELMCTKSRYSYLCLTWR